MRHVPTMGLALLGLALAVPAVGAGEGDPNPDAHSHGRVRRLGTCPKCEAARAEGRTPARRRRPAVELEVAPGDRHGQGHQHATLPQPNTPQVGEAAMPINPGAYGGAYGGDAGIGLASSGGPAPGLEPGEAVGYATTGRVPAANLAVSGEPTPIGVMRTNYSTPNQLGMPAPGMATAGGPGTMGPMPAGGPGWGGMPAGAQGYGAGPTYGRPGKGRSGVLASMFGLRGFGRMSKEREARARSLHAAEAYGAPGSGPVELPASAVYGR